MSDVRIPSLMFLIFLGVAGVTSQFWLIPDLLVAIAFVIGLLSFTTFALLVWWDCKQHKRKEE